MNALQIRNIHIELNNDLSSFFKLSSAEKIALANKLKFDNVHTLEKALKEYIDRNANRETEPVKIVTSREYLDGVPDEKKYAGAGWIGRVFGGDASPEEVLQEAGYTDKQIQHFKQLRS